VSLNDRSLANLQGVHTDLVRVVARADQIIEGLEPMAGFHVTEGLRALLKQEQLVKTGASRTMKSRHLTGHAVDLMATIGGDGRWEFNLYYRVALAMRRAAVETRTPVEWGGCWMSLLAIADSEDAMAQAVAKYSARARAAGTRPFLDGVHFQLAADVYP
jgi:peptidoglycan L-alanyl-D-glutamate endopeptidase CwlK